jgi:hypothetical protein
MNIKFDQIPSPSKLIMTMDKHPVGVSLYRRVLDSAGGSGGLFNAVADVPVMVLVPSAVPVAAVLKPTQVEKTTKSLEIWNLPFRLIAYLNGPSIERVLKRKMQMNINFQDLPSPVKLITVMDKHPEGAKLFLVAMLMCLVAAVVLAWMWMYPR